MEWFQNLFVNIDSVAHIIVLYALVISIGLGLGRLKLFGCRWCMCELICMVAIYERARIFVCMGKLLSEAIAFPSLERRT